ncbi:Geranylfarnesyl diphosphate synthase [uncultured archaeon]|nr:Geranylfarnesyl diphosphate synthase [uncultured archaeon]
MRIDAAEAPTLPDKITGALELTSSRLRSLSAGDFVDRRLFGPSVHLLNSQGKMLRPALVLLGALALGEDPYGYVDLAAALELLHTSSLIHDDLIDGDSKRRGTEAVHVKYGNDAAILAGDALMSKAIILSSQYGTEVISEISKSAMDMCAGEMLDSYCQKSTAAPTLAAYLRIASLKSASLIGVSASSVAVHRKNRLAPRLHAFGIDCGIAFQIRDDVLERVDGARAKLHRKEPNFVSVLRERDGLGEEGAMLKAVELNLKYIARAKKAIGGQRMTLLRSYADSICLCTT